MNEHISILQGYIDHLEYMKKNAYELFDREQADRDIKAFKAAIKALEQEPCEDAVSRQAVLDITWEEPSYADPLNVLTEVRDKVNDLPPVTPQPKTGHWWINGNYHVRCSECGEDYPYRLRNYCPNCGSRMIEQEEREDKE